MKHTPPDPMRNFSSEEAMALLALEEGYPLDQRITHETWQAVVRLVHDAIPKLQLDLAFDTKRPNILMDICNKIDQQIMDLGLLNREAMHARPLVILRRKIGLRLAMRSRLGVTPFFQDFLQEIRKNKGRVPVAQCRSNPKFKSIIGKMNALISDGMTWEAIANFLAEQAGMPISIELKKPIDGFDELLIIESRAV